MAGEMTFTRAGEDKFIIDHTGVEGKFEGNGFAKQLVMTAVEFAGTANVKILPLCPYANKLFEKDQSIQDVRV